MESQLRRSALLCRRMAGGVLLLGGLGATAIAALFARDPDEGAFFAQALLMIMFALLTSLALALLLFLAAARTMDGLADLLGDRTRPLVPEPAAVAPVFGRASAPAGQGDSNGETAPAARPASDGRVANPETVTSPAVREHIRWGDFVKVTTADGVTGWVRDVDLPPTGSVDLPPAS